MSEHKKNAEWLLHRASHYREHGGIETAKACAQAAQAEATLALVEQQHAGNLINYLLMMNDNVETTEDALTMAAGILVEVQDVLDLAPKPAEPRSDRDRAWDGATDGGRLG